MDYDFITTCNWTATGTYTFSAYRGSLTNVASSYSFYYRKKGDTTWTETTNGTIVIASTGEWELANNWNKDGNNVLTHAYHNNWTGITAINSCTDVYFNETGLGTTVGDFFLYALFYGCTSLASMPSGFNMPTGITTVGSNFLISCWYGCTSLKSMPSGFNLPTGITSVGNGFITNTWHNCTSLTSMPAGFNLPTGITTVGNDFLTNTWHNCTKLTEMPIGFNLPQGITNAKNNFLVATWMRCKALKTIPSDFSLPSSLTSIGTDFMRLTWNDCTALDDDATTENLYFKYAGTNTFGGTCPISPDSPTAGSNVAVNRGSKASTTNTTNFFLFFQ